jgi:acyl-CoA synthetase (AMP-forming)/AMP-acid ligase II
MQFDERATRPPPRCASASGGRGDRVAFLAQNSTDHFETMFACWLAQSSCR